MLGDIQEGCLTIFYGKMGSGKTTNAMKEVLRFWRRGSPVWVNFPITELPKAKGSELDIWREDDPAGIVSMRHGLFVLDEAYMTLNSREWAALPKPVFTAFTHLRKLDMTCIVIAQSWMRIDKSIRELASYAREFRGSALFGYWYDYTEYEVDELGDIVKQEPREYAAARRSFSIVMPQVYRAFDTDYLFTKEGPPKRWESAIIKRPAKPVAAPPSPRMRPAIESAPLPPPLEG